MAVRKKPLRKTLPKDFNTLLFESASSGDYSAVHAVFEVCEIDARDSGKRTALMAASCTPELARWLVARGADVHAQDGWGNTALHQSAFARFHHKLPVSVLIELGADVHCTNRSGMTAMHSAADGKNLASVAALLASGAAVDTPEVRGLTPLEYALQRVSNADLVAMVPVASALVAAGAVVSERSRGFVLDAARNFGFHRAGFAKDYVEVTAAASRALCELFEVEPPPPRPVHDGKAAIVAKPAPWQQPHAELFNLLVPSRGACTTVQGEVIRIAGRVGDELNRNGGRNWDSDYDAMVRAFLGHVAAGDPLSPVELDELKGVTANRRSLAEGGGRLAELAVAWVARNPQPVSLSQPAYSR